MVGDGTVKAGQVPLVPVLPSAPTIATWIPTHSPCAALVVMTLGVTPTMLSLGEGRAAAPVSAIARQTDNIAQ